MQLGDLIESALTKVGITKERVERWLGRPCNCTQRKQKLNALSVWASRVFSGRTEEAEKYLDVIMEGETPKTPATVPGKPVEEPRA